MSQHATIGSAPTVGSRPVSTLSATQIVSSKKTAISTGGQRRFGIVIGLRERHGFQCNQSPAPGVNKDKILFLPGASSNIQRVQLADGCGDFAVTILQPDMPVAFSFRVRFEEDRNRTGIIKPVQKDCQLTFMPIPGPDGTVDFTIGDVSVDPGPDPEP
jgi:hypothetical protein